MPKHKTSGALTKFSALIINHKIKITLTKLIIKLTHTLFVAGTREPSTNNRNYFKLPQSLNIEALSLILVECKPQSIKLINMFTIASSSSAVCNKTEVIRRIIGLIIRTIHLGWRHPAVDS